MIGQRNLEESLHLPHALRAAKVDRVAGSWHGWRKTKFDRCLDARHLVSLTGVHAKQGLYYLADQRQSGLDFAPPRYGLLQPGLHYGEKYSIRA